MLAVLVMVATTVVALVRQGEAERRRELVFQGQAEQLRLEILEAIDREGERFRTAVDFVAVTHPGPLEQFRAYFAKGADRIGEPQSSFDFILIEHVEASEFAELTERERAFGNPEFEIRSLAAGLDGERLIITRTGAEAVGGEIEVTGLDVTGFEAQIPVEVPEGGYALRVLEPDPALRLVLQMAGGGTEVAASQAESIRTYALLVSPVPGPDGGVGMDDRLASAIRLVPISDLLDPVDRRMASGLEASLLVDGIEQPVARVIGSESRTPGATDLGVTYDLSTDGQRWTLEVVATPDFGAPIGLFDPLGTWAFGLTTASLGGLAMLARNWHRRRVLRAERELASARTVAATDGLTGLLNRVGFVERSAELDGRMSAATFFIDLDGFKNINDRDGHQAGDRVLREVAERLRRSTRPTDLVSRLGGDEFIVHAQGMDEGAAEAFALRIVEIVDQVDEHLSCSVGVALRDPGESVTLDELLRRADAAMYEVKRAGGHGHRMVRARSHPAKGGESPPPSPEPDESPLVRVFRDW